MSTSWQPRAGHDPIPREDVRTGPTDRRTYPPRRLAAVREAFGLSQTAVAERLQVSQSRVSRIERGDLDHLQVATLRAFVRALGGDLELCARVGDDRIVLG
jgi:predicted transcriptional regulator